MLFLESFYGFTLHDISKGELHSLYTLGSWWHYVEEKKNLLKFEFVVYMYSQLLLLYSIGARECRTKLISLFEYKSERIENEKIKKKKNVISVSGVYSYKYRKKYSSAKKKI